ncbi:MAG: hypothetical protein ACLUD9_03705 [Anaerotignum faecicola]
MLYENESFQLNPEKMPKHVAIIMDATADGQQSAVCPKSRA